VSKDIFKFYIPADIQKAYDESGKEVMKFKGIASTGEKDSQGEWLDPSGMDFSQFKWVNWNHLGSKDSATIIGEPTKAVITPKNELDVEGILYPEVAMAQTTWNLMKALQNSPSGNKLGISVEGKVVARASNDKKSPLYNRITKSRITGIALCPIPINGGTWADIIKGEMHEDLQEEEYDEETKKAMEANPSLTKESVEGDKERGKDAILKKSDVAVFAYENISQDTEIIKSFNQLVQKISIMNKKEITADTIKKAMDILSITENVIEKGEGGKPSNNDDDDEMDSEEIEKAKMLSKKMKDEGKEEEEVEKSLRKKGYNDTFIEKAMDGLFTAASQSNSVTAELRKSFSDIESMIVKSADATATRFGAIGDLFEKTFGVIDSLVEKLEKSEETHEIVSNLNEKLSKVLNFNPGPRGVQAKSYSEKFEKSEDGVMTFNLSSDKDRKALGDKLEEIAKSSNDDSFLQAASDLEISKSIKGDIITRLATQHKVEIVKES
jgi:hypothetical protein